MEKNTKICEVCGRELPLSDFSKSYKNRCRECVAAKVRSERHDGKKSTDNIDWEQRRYELAKAAMQGFLSNDNLEITLNNESYEEALTADIDAALDLITNKKL